MKELARGHLLKAGSPRLPRQQEAVERTGSEPFSDVVSRVFSGGTARASFLCVDGDVHETPPHDDRVRGSWLGRKNAPYYFNWRLNLTRSGLDGTEGSKALAHSGFTVIVAVRTPGDSSRRVFALAAYCPATISCSALG